MMIFFIYWKKRCFLVLCYKVSEHLRLKCISLLLAPCFNTYILIQWRLMRIYIPDECEKVRFHPTSDVICLSCSWMMTVGQCKVVRLENNVNLTYLYTITFVTLSAYLFFQIVFVYSKKYFFNIVFMCPNKITLVTLFLLHIWTK